MEYRYAADGRAIGPGVRRWLGVFALSVPLAASVAGTPAPGGVDFNQVPNAALLGTTGVVVGPVDGQVPAGWRAFAVGGGEITLATTPLAADALFPGSPPANAVKLTVEAFGADQGFDHTEILFQLLADRDYRAAVFLRTGNADDSNQSVSVGLPVFDDLTTFSGRDPGAFGAVTTSDWQLFQGPVFSEDANRYAHMSFRLADDGGENSVLIALPTVASLPTSNVVPNPAFTGAGGALVQSVVGAVPDDWRAFGVDDGELTVTIEALPPGAVYPGSPATNAVVLDAVNLINGQGFDHEGAFIDVVPGHPYHVEAFVRSANADASRQAVSMAVPLFDAGGFTARQPGSRGVTVGPDWDLIVGPAFAEADGVFFNMAFRPVADGGQDSIQIALPRIVGPPPGRIFGAGFEDGDPLPLVD